MRTLALLLFSALLFLPTSFHASFAGTLVGGSCNALLVKNAEFDYLNATADKKKQTLKSLQRAFREYSYSLPAPATVSQATIQREIDLSSAQKKIGFAKSDPSFRSENELGIREILDILTTPGAAEKLEPAFTIRLIRHTRLPRGPKLPKISAIPVVTPMAKGLASITNSLVFTLPRFLYTASTINAAPANRSATANWWVHSAKLASSLLIPLVNVISPISFSSKKQTKAIFARLENSPDMNLSAEEETILKKNHALDTFKSRQNFLQRNPWAPLVLARPLYIVKKLATVVSLSGALGLFAMGELNPHGVIDYQTYLNNPVYAPTEEQIQVINEAYPIPHLAVRIGEKVYSYGFNSMSATPARAYFAPTSSANVNRKAVQVLTLRLPRNEVQKLQRYLSFQEFKHYQNFTFVNDCSSMIVKALNLNTSIRVPRIIDPSPSMVMMYLASQEDNHYQISDYRMVVQHPENNPHSYLVQALYLNLRDAYLNQSLILLNQLNRALLENSFDELQSFSKGVKQELKRLQDDVALDFSEDTELQYYLKTAAHPKNPTDDANYEFARTDAHAYFLREYQAIHENILASNADVLGLVTMYYRSLLLNEYEETIFGTKTYDFKKDLNDPAIMRELDDVNELPIN